MGDRHLQRALGTRHFQLLADLDLYAARQRDRFFTNSRHISPLDPGTSTWNKPLEQALACKLYHTRQRISPPMCSLCASRPVMTPRGVVKMLIPIPPSTRGMSVCPTYTRQPGRETRSIAEITGELLEPYFK